MREYWLLDQHGADGPTALVETDGRMRIIDVLRFGPSITEVDDQQKLWDEIIGRVAPTMKPLVDASSIDEKGVAVHRKVRHGEHGGGGKANRAGRGDGGRRGPGGGHSGPGASRKRSGGDR